MRLYLYTLLRVTLLHFDFDILLPKLHIVRRRTEKKKSPRLTITFYSYHVSMLLWHLTVINYCDDVTLPYWLWGCFISSLILSINIRDSKSQHANAEIVINKISGKWYKKYQWKCEKYVVEVGLF